MTPALLLTVAVTLGVALLVSEGLLVSLGLNRVRLGSLMWLAAVVAVGVGARWADGHTSYPEARIHFAALVVAAAVTCLWFNDHRPLPANPSRPVPKS